MYPVTHPAVIAMLENPNAPCALSRATAAVKFAKISDIVVPIAVEPGSGFRAKFSTPTPPVAVSETKREIAVPPPSLSARYITNMKPPP